MKQNSSSPLYDTRYLTLLYIHCGLYTFRTAIVKLIQFLLTYSQFSERRC